MKKSTFSTLLCMAIISLLFVQQGTAQHVSSSWKRLDEFGNNNKINALAMVAGARKFYAGTNQGVFYRGLLANEDWKRVPGSASTAKAHQFEGEIKYLKFLYKPTSPNETRYYRINNTSPTTLSRGGKACTGSTLGAGRSLYSSLSNFYIALDGTLKKSLNNVKYSFSGITRVSSYLNSPNASLSSLQTRANASKYYCYTYFKTNQPVSNVLLGGNGFVMRDQTIPGRAKAWHLIDKGLSGAGKIKGLLAVKSTNTVFLFTDNKRVYKSTNNGTSWSRFDNGSLQHVTQIKHLAYFGKYLYAATNTSAIYVIDYTKSNARWEQFGSPLPSNARPEKLFATINELVVSTNRGVYRRSLK